LLFIGMRGGFGLKPIKSQDASKWVVMGLENLSLNTPFQIISSIDSDSEIFPFSHIPIENTISFYKEFSPVENKIKPNIVLVILESMGRDYVGFMNKEPLGLTPFIDSLAEHCAVFVNCYANSTRSAEAIPALYAGIPHILNKTFQYSIFQGNTIRGSHYYLNQIGYQNSFYHGAANGIMGFESFLKKTGPIKYHGLNQYPYKKEHHDGKWGIFDHHYLSYFAKELSKKEEPFFAGVFTLSSHHPFKVPDEYKQILPEGHMPIHKSVAYTDLSLRQFFSEVAKSKSHQNTIYIIIGDHTSQSHREYYATSKGRLELLCMVYDARNLIEKGVYFNTVQQIDLLPSILNIAGYTQKFLSLGNSFFDSSNSNIGAITLMDGNFQYIKNEHVLKLSPDNKVEFKYMPKDNLPDKFQTYYKKENEKVMKSELLQTLNFFWDRMEKNKFY
jgi:phosphoglycerol transferase MdoB-like AlkP superfamily enzyme